MALTIFQCMVFTFAVLSGIFIIFDVWESCDDNSNEFDVEERQKLLKEITKQQFYRSNDVSINTPRRFYH